MSSGGSLHPDQGDNPGVFMGLLTTFSAPNPKLRNTHHAGFRALTLETASSEMLKKISKSWWT